MKNIVILVGATGSNKQFLIDLFIEKGYTELSHRDLENQNGEDDLIIETTYENLLAVSPSIVSFAIRHGYIVSVCEWAQANA